MCKITFIGSVQEISLEMLSKEKDIEIHYAPDLPLAEIFNIIAPFNCIWTGSVTRISKELIN